MNFNKFNENNGDTVPNFWFIFSELSKTLEVPKSMTLINAPSLFDSKSRFSGFRSLLRIINKVIN